MAKVTVTFEDVEEGISVKVESDPPFPGPAATQEEQDNLTDAQHMGLRMTHQLTAELHENDEEDSFHVHDENCQDQKCPYLAKEQSE
jgi:hypothetical protein